MNHRQKILITIILLLVFGNTLLIFNSSFFSILNYLSLLKPFPPISVQNNISDILSVQVNQNAVSNFLKDYKALHNNNAVDLQSEKYFYPKQIHIVFDNIDKATILASIKRAHGLQALGYNYTTMDNQVIITFFLNEGYITSIDAEALKQDLQLLTTEAFIRYKIINHKKESITIQDEQAINKELRSIYKQYSFVTDVKKQ